MAFSVLHCLFATSVLVWFLVLFFYAFVTLEGLSSHSSPTCSSARVDESSCNSQTHFEAIVIWVCMVQRFELNVREQMMEQWHFCLYNLLISLSFLYIYPGLLNYFFSIERRQGGHTDFCRGDQVAVRWQIRCSRTSAKIGATGSILRYFWNP